MRRAGVSALLTVGCVFLAATAGRVAAAPVAPGDTAIAIDNSGFVAPTGDLLDSSSQTVTLSFVDATVPTPTDVDVTFNSQVLRDPATQRLTFVYSFDSTAATFPTMTNITSALTLAAFGTFATDVTSDTALNVDRSADGSTLTHTTNAGDAVQLPTIAVATDATAFDNNGSASGAVNGEVASPETGTTPIGAQFSISNTFQPLADDGGGGGGGGGAIPLPAGVWFGIVGLLSGGVYKRFGRKVQLA
jgi:hypothetical protein